MIKYNVSSATFFFVGLGMAFCLFVAVLLAKKYSRRKLSLRREMNIAVLIVYSLFVASLTFCPVYFSIQLSGTVSFKMANINYIPLTTFIYNVENIFGNSAAQVNGLYDFIVFFFGNLFLLLPVGLLLPQISKKMRRFSNFILISFLISLIKEFIQFIESSIAYAPGKGANTDDIILNLIGAVLGFMLLKYLRKHFEFSE